MSKIKIGWMKCGIYEREKELKCFRCWELGHIKANCKGSDRSTLCAKCAKPGHMANACQNESYCVHCQEVGHQSGSRRCPKSGKMKDGASSSQNERGNSGGSQNQDDPSQCG
ncbi:Zinc knuckle [Popillia japonica]